MIQVKDMVQQSFDFSPVTSLEYINDHNMLSRLVTGFNVSTKTADKTLRPILEYLKEEDKESYPLMLQGPYGAGKTHTLCLLSGMFLVPIAREEWVKRIPLSKFAGLVELIESVSKQEHNIIAINCLNGHDLSFSHLIQDRVKNVMNLKGISVGSDALVNIIHELSNTASITYSAFKNYLGEDNLEDLLSSIKTGGELSQQGEQKLRQVWEDCFPVPLGDIYQSFGNFLSLLTDITKRCGYRSTIILLDEWSSYFQARMGQAGVQSDLFDFQQLLEHSLISRNALKIISVSHVSLEEEGYWHGRTDTLQLLRKIAGRVRPVELQASTSLETIPQLFERSDIFYNTLSKIPQSWPIIQVQRVFNNNIQDTYPIHPFVIEILPPLVSKYGQAQRTIKHFFDWAFKRIENDQFINGEKVRIVNTSDIFDYFFGESSITQDELVFNSIKELLQKIEHIVNGPEIAKALIVKYFAYTSMGLTTNYRNGLTIRQIGGIIQLTEPAVEDALQLVAGENILFNPDTQMYAFLPSGTVSKKSLEDEIKNNVSEMTYRHAFDYCRTRFNLHSYSRAFFTPFKHQVDYLFKFEDELHEPDEVKLIFVLPRDEFYNLDLAQLSKKYQNILFVQTQNVPSEYAVKRYAAIGQLKDKSGRTEYELAYLRDRQALVGDSLREQFRGLFTPRKSILWRNGISESIDAGDWDAVVLNLLNKVYNACPEFTLDEFKADRKIISQIIPYIVKSEGEVPIQSDLRRFFTGIMQGLDLADFDGDYYRIRVPDEKKSKAWTVWLELSNYVDQNDGLTLVYDKLNAAPYGLPPTVIEAILATFLALRFGRLYRVAETEACSLNDLVLKEVTTYRSKRYRVITTRTAGNLSQEIDKKKIIANLLETASNATTIIHRLENIGLKNKKLRTFISGVANINSESAADLKKLADGEYLIKQIIASVNENANTLEGIYRTISSFEKNDTRLSVLRDAILKFEFGGHDEFRRLINDYLSLYDNCYRQFVSEHKELGAFLTKSLAEHNLVNNEMPTFMVPCSLIPFNSPETGASIVCQNPRCKLSLGELDNRKSQIKKYITDINQLHDEWNDLMDLAEDDAGKDLVDEKKLREKRLDKDDAVKVVNDSVVTLLTEIESRREWSVTQLLKMIRTLGVTILSGFRGKAR
jgi:hypothetical protein